eukprot:CAMPEP_0205822116 /NCGR_PEP_ID=MMETSP0206-20130828/10904_1 /ASSEMBLY_ACC=CAM_ASM_000279 /TAXON_ID=36767 /ORGANISM="Euplotes focardii, Strain TN1" /LENGTH=181 /DNA_ID=CAMNT_0053118111 /DNA_START=64 /DNA_END=610 /DNA_ORIENTATION=+
MIAATVTMTGIATTTAGIAMMTVATTTEVIVTTTIVEEEEVVTTTIAEEEVVERPAVITSVVTATVEAPAATRMGTTTEEAIVGTAHLKSWCSRLVTGCVLLATATTFRDEWSASNAVSPSRVMARARALVDVALAAAVHVPGRDAVPLSQAEQIQVQEPTQRPQQRPQPVKGTQQEQKQE